MKTIAIVWLWYVWLPLAYHLAKKWNQIIWFDVSKRKLEELWKWFDATQEIWDKISEVNIEYTDDKEKIWNVDIVIVTVPTPVNKNNDPDYTPLIKASETIGSVLKKWQIVVYESTVDPGATEEICLPILEEKSWLKCPSDFSLWYSPERINPWDKEHTVDKIAKVVSASDSKALETLAEMYGSITSWVIHKASSIKVAETSKIIENTQRDINIAVINEIAKICDKLWISTYDVLEASWTKWNFLKFTPGLVWWHCIWVDPYYLAKRAQKLWLHPDVILSGRRINDDMPIWVADQVIKMMIKNKIDIANAKILILWLTFKENVPDFRNSKISTTIRELKDFWLDIKWYDPYHTYLHEHDIEELNLEKSEIVDNLDWKYDCIIFAQSHKEFEDININNLLNNNWVIFDIKWKLRNKWFKNYKTL